MDPMSTPMISRSFSKKMSNKGRIKRIFKIGCFSVLGLFVLAILYLLGWWHITVRAGARSMISTG